MTVLDVPVADMTVLDVPVADMTVLDQRRDSDSRNQSPAPTPVALWKPCRRTPPRPCFEKARFDDWE